MATSMDKFNRFADKLRELFQLDQPELDFGIYRVMHLKREAVEHYLDPKATDGLHAAVKSVFSSVNAQAATAALDAARAKVVENFGADAIDADGALFPAFSRTPAGKVYVEARAAVAAGKDATEGEKDVYDLLLDFFSRYYKDGDFVSLRRVTRETGTRAKPYAIPYAGEEVKLHWATADQYYIKTSENFSNYTFDLSEAREIKSMDEMARMVNRIPDRPMRVHFKIVEAKEGEHNNVKANEERYFFVDWEHPFEISDHPEAELTVFFRHEADPEKPDKAKNWQKQLLVKSRNRILDYLDSFTGGLDSDYDSHPVHAYLAMLRTPCPTDGNKERILLDRYLEQYTARNTEDYFIHKNLGAFLRRELEFYVKNEILNVSDLAAQSDDSLLTVSEAQLLRARAFYRVARRIVDDFLAPLEDFQKKLWLKKKFVVQCDWCITLDLVPEALRAKVLSNDAQLAEWKRLGGGSDPKANNLRATDARMVDTKFFDAGFKAKLLDAIPNLDECTSGVLVRSENFQALRLLQERYKGQVKCSYIDPPYNTGNDGFLYKDGYSHSSWITMVENRLAQAKSEMSKDGVIFMSIDDNEVSNLRRICDEVFGGGNFIGQWNWFKSATPPNLSKKIKKNIEYILCYENEKNNIKYVGIKKISKSSNGLLNQSNSYHELVFPEGTVETGLPDGVYKAGQYGTASYDIKLLEDAIVAQGRFSTKVRLAGKFKWTQPKLEKELANGTTIAIQTETFSPSYEKQEYDPEVPPNLIDKTVMVSTTEQAGDDLDAMFGVMKVFDYPKPISLIAYLASFASSPNDIIFDFFAGSGTTGHAVIDLNRQDRENGIKAKRKYILVEMGEHFDTVLKPRIEKVVYSPNWKDGKPECSDKGISHCFKYLTLESYEDTLNNLSFDQEPSDASGVDGYLMRYMLSVGIRGSSSLLDVAAFAHPFSCTLDVKKPGGEGRETRVVDLVETFNWLLGLRVRKMSERLRFSADFERLSDPAIPSDDTLKLRVSGELRKDGEGPFTFQFVDGTIPRNRHEPTGAADRVLVVWREGTGNSEEDNAVLDAFLQDEKVNALKGKYELIYVNGSNNVSSLRGTNQTWKVRLIEETFLKRMWEEA